MSISNYLEEKLLNLVFHGDAYSPPGSLYISLHTADPGDTGANELVGGSYARQAATFDAASNPAGTTQTSGALDFAGMPGTTITHVGVWDTGASGNFLWGGPLGISEPVNVGNTFHFDAGAILAALS